MVTLNQWSVIPKRLYEEMYGLYRNEKGTLPVEIVKRTTKCLTCYQAWFAEAVRHPKNSQTLPPPGKPSWHDDIQSPKGVRASLTIWTPPVNLSPRLYRYVCRSEHETYATGPLRLKWEMATQWYCDKFVDPARDKGLAPAKEAYGT